MTMLLGSSPTVRKKLCLYVLEKERERERERERDKERETEREIERGKDNWDREECRREAVHWAVNDFLHHVVQNV